MTSSEMAEYDMQCRLTDEVLGRDAHAMSAGVFWGCSALLLSSALLVIDVLLRCPPEPDTCLLVLIELYCAVLTTSYVA